MKKRLIRELFDRGKKKSEVKKMSRKSESQMKKRQDMDFRGNNRRQTAHPVCITNENEVLCQHRNRIWKKRSGRE